MANNRQPSLFVVTIPCTFVWFCYGDMHLCNFFEVETVSATFGGHRVTLTDVFDFQRGISCR